MTIFARRVIAYVIDFLVISAFMWILSFFLFGILGPKNVYQAYKYFTWLIPILGLAYFILSEKMAGASIGKAIMRLEVKSRNGANISWLQAIVRNLTKIYWVPIIFDWLFGRLLNTDRIMNNITRTTVVNAW